MKWPVILKFSQEFVWECLQFGLEIDEKCQKLDGGKKKRINYWSDEIFTQHRIIVFFGFKMLDCFEAICTPCSTFLKLANICADKAAKLIQGADSPMF